MRQKEVSKQRTELERRAKELDTRQTQTALDRHELTRCRQELEMRLRGMQDKVTEKTHRNLGVTCTVEEELMETAQSSLGKLAPMSGEILTLE